MFRLPFFQKKPAIGGKEALTAEKLRFGLPEEMKNLDLFKFFYALIDFDSLAGLIAKESMRYACQNGRVFDCSKEDVVVFYGIYLYMGLVHLPWYRDYWRKDEFGQPFVRNAMSRNRWEEILRNLHFSNNLSQFAKEDKAWKVRSLIQHYNYVYQRYAYDTSEQSIDEHTCKFKGKNSMKQYIKNKPIPWGFKFWQRCDGETGYLYQFDIYTGKKQFPELGLGESVVLELASSLAGTYTTIYADNFFSSPTLVKQLLASKIYYTGVVRPDRKGMPFKTRKDSKKEKKKKVDEVPKQKEVLQRGEFVIFHCKEESMNVVKWIDNKPVHVITSKNPCSELTTVLRRKKGQADKVTVKCPGVVKDYNTYMGGVDIHDQMTQTNHSNRRAKFRYYIRISHNLLEQAVVNARIAWQTLHPDEKITAKDFRLQVCKGLVSQSTGRLRAPSETTSQRDNELGVHLPKVIARSRCIVCSQRKEDLKSSWGCTTCPGAFCILANRNCFTEFHAEMLL